MPKDLTVKEKANREHWLDGYEAAVRERIGHYATPCKGCGGLGVKVYGSTATWRGGIGGQAMTGDVCDECWGSGDAEKPWLNLREYDYIIYKAKQAKVI